MSRRSLLRTVAILLGLLASAAGVLACMVKHEPAFYRRVELPPGAERAQWSRKFEQAVPDLITEIMSEKKWGARFSQDQINSYFEEGLARAGGLGKNVFPANISAPRIAIDSDRLRVAFRYGGKRWSTIISLDLNVWLAAREPNVVAVEILKMRAGALPIALQSVLEHFSEVARRQDIELNWYRRNGKPVALLRFGSGRNDPSIQLLQLRLQPGALTISGADRTKPVAPIDAVPTGLTGAKKG